MNTDINANPAAQMGVAPGHSQFARPQQAAPQVQPAGFWIRAVALFIDSFIINVITLPIHFGMQIALPALVGMNEDPIMMLMLSLIVGVVYLVLYSLYVGYFYTRKGATPGKLIFQIVVVNSKNGTYCSFWQAVWRETLGKFLSYLILGIGFLMAAFSHDKQALHDKIFSTQVLRKTN